MNARLGSDEVAGVNITTGRQRSVPASASHEQLRNQLIYKINLVGVKLTYVFSMFVGGGDHAKPHSRGHAESRFRLDFIRHIQSVASFGLHETRTEFIKPRAAEQIFFAWNSAGLSDLMG